MCILLNEIMVGYIGKLDLYVYSYIVSVPKDYIIANKKQFWAKYEHALINLNGKWY